MLLQQTKQTKLLVVNSKMTSRFATLPNLLPQMKPLGTIEPSTINFNHSSFLPLNKSNQTFKKRS